jgi:hypothetical protein
VWAYSVACLCYPFRLPLKARRRSRVVLTTWEGASLERPILRLPTRARLAVRVKVKRRQADEVAVAADAVEHKRSLPQLLVCPTTRKPMA